MKLNKISNKNAFTSIVDIKILNYNSQTELYNLNNFDYLFLIYRNATSIIFPNLIFDWKSLEKIIKLPIKETIRKQIEY